jgi:hypothetical protein
MKTIVFSFFYLLTTCSAYCQKNDSIIYLTTHTATYVQFNGLPLIGADIGETEGVIFDTLPASSSLIRLQAKKEFVETNILFVFKDTLISCRLRYISALKKPIYTINLGKIGAINYLSSSKAVTDRKKKIAYIYNIPKKISITEKQSDVLFEVTNLVVDSDSLYIKIKVDNKSDFNYKIDRIQFQTVNKKSGVKSTAISKITPTSIDEFGNPNAVPPNTSKVFIYSFAQFTPNEKESVLITFVEAQKNSLGRNVTIKLSQKNFRNVTTIE